LESRCVGALVDEAHALVEGGSGERIALWSHSVVGAFKSSDAIVEGGREQVELFVSRAFSVGEGLVQLVQMLVFKSVALGVTERVRGGSLTRRRSFAIITAAFAVNVDYTSFTSTRSTANTSDIETQLVDFPVNNS
jgi:hypothetical protein